MKITQMIITFKFFEFTQQKAKTPKVELGGPKPDLRPNVNHSTKNQYYISWVRLYMGKLRIQA